MKKFLFNLIRKRKYNIYIYTEDVFERRCQEEIIRSDNDNSFFVYLEFDFEVLRKKIDNETKFTNFWEILFATINKDVRRSDIVGFLENATGIGILLFDTKIIGWERIKNRMVQMSNSYEFQNFAKILDEVIKPILYPACIRDIVL